MGNNVILSNNEEPSIVLFDQQQTNLLVDPLTNSSGPIVEVSENTPIVFSGVQDEVGQVPDGNKGDITVSNNGNTWTLNDINENVNVITGTYSSKLNQALLIKARKDTAGTITKGQVVYITGSTGTHLTVELARADVEATSAYTIGIAATTITSNNDGFVMQYGRLTGLSTLPTATYTEGQALYLSETTAGGYRVGIPEAPNHGVLLGFIIRTSNGGAGELDVRIQNYQELEELSDVYITGANVNDFLVKKATRWENTTSANVKTILAINNVDNTSDLNKPISTATQTALDVKQNTLVSGTNIKTINNQSILGSGNLTISGGSATESFETVSKNLKSWGGTLNYTGGVLTSIVYTDGIDTITKTFNYTSGVLTSIVLSGDTPIGIDLTKTLGYTSGDLTSITYS
jgi:hypothetical protein